jgi:hypothetical protein
VSCPSHPEAHEGNGATLRKRRRASSPPGTQGPVHSLGQGHRRCHKPGEPSGCVGGLSRRKSKCDAAAILLDSTPESFPRPGTLTGRAELPPPSPQPKPDQNTFQSAQSQVVVANRRDNNPDRYRSKPQVLAISRRSNFAISPAVSRPEESPSTRSVLSDGSRGSSAFPGHRFPPRQYRRAGARLEAFEPSPPRVGSP